MNHNNTVKKLERLDACNEGMEWVRRNGGDMATLWNQCPKAEWMAWFIGENSRLTKKPELVKAALEVAKRVLKKTAANKKNISLYKEIIKEVSAFAKGNGDSEYLNDLYKTLNWHTPDDGDRIRLFGELTEVVTIPRGSYAFFTYAAMAEVYGVKGNLDEYNRQKERAQMAHANILRKYFEVGERGLQVKE